MMINCEKLYERLDDIISNKGIHTLDNPTNEDRMTTQKLCRLIEQYMDLVGTNYRIDCYTMLEALITTLSWIHGWLKFDVISKDDAQEMIDVFKDI